MWVSQQALIISGFKAIRHEAPSHPAEARSSIVTKATTMVRSVLNSPSPNRAMAQTVSASQFKVGCLGLMPRVDSTPLPTSRERLRTAWEQGLVGVCALSLCKQQAGQGPLATQFGSAAIGPSL